jgi:hypothetical protein
MTFKASYKEKKGRLHYCTSQPKTNACTVIPEMSKAFFFTMGKNLERF